MRSYQDLLDAARTHRDNLLADINNASTRLEHVRLTALAQGAENLLTELENFAFGLVYSHSAAAMEQRKFEELSGLELEG
jgi:hypothetical protein